VSYLRNPVWSWSRNRRSEQQFVQGSEIALNGSQNSPDVVVVGSGPAGLAATNELLTNGLSVTLVDEGNALGGQFYRQQLAAPELSRGSDLDDRSEKAAEAVRFPEHDALTIETRALAWGVFPDRQLTIYRDGASRVLESRAILFACGAIERSAAFPGWTLPGVVMAGGVQASLSREAILPGKRFVLAGTGPLLLAIALEVSDAGGEVVAVVEGARSTAPVRQVHRFLSYMGRLKQGIDYHRALRDRGIPVLNGYAVREARGDGQVEEVVLTRLGNDWTPEPGSDQVLEADTLCVHFGFEALTELPRMAGCDADFDRMRGGWYVAHDEGMRTNVPGIYVAGQVSGIGGVDLSSATGSLAGATVSLDLGRLDPVDYQKASEALRKKITHERSFAEILHTIYTPGSGLANLIEPSTTICRCEEVAASEVDDAIVLGATTVNDVKRRTRCGMGRCQGRICTPIVTAYLNARAGVPAQEAGLITARPPVKPIPLRALAEMATP
jgi:thioredoxin reductase/bacterioferritin-associated ferredoxin